MPVWWALRTLCAVVAVHLLLGLVSGLGVLALVAIVISVQTGRGAWWPGTVLHRSLFLRVVLIGLNAFAVLLLPVGGRVQRAADLPGRAGGQRLRLRRPGPAADRHPARRRQRPRLSLSSSEVYDDMTGTQKVLSPWMNGRTELYSVFPLPERLLDPETGSPVGEAALGAPPFASLPPVTLDGVLPSVLLPQAEAAGQSAGQPGGAAGGGEREEGRRRARGGSRSSGTGDGAGERPVQCPAAARGGSDSPPAAAR